MKFVVGKSKKDIKRLKAGVGMFKATNLSDSESSQSDNVVE